MSTRCTGCSILLMAATMAGCADGTIEPGGTISGGLGDGSSGTGLVVIDTSSSSSSDDEQEPSSSSDGETSLSTDPTTVSSGVVPPDVATECLPATSPCVDSSECCVEDNFACDTTTLGEVCCGLEGASCATENGEDCCGALLCVAGQCLPAGAVPPFQAPFACNESWTYSHHSAEVRRALDFINNSGATDNAPALAAAAGVATQHYEAGGAGNYIVVDHWGGWVTYYFHLQSFSVDDGVYVQQGDEVGRVGSTGASSGPHLHFEELYNGEGQDIWLGGELLAPYPGSYGQASVTSMNCP